MQPMHFYQISVPSSEEPQRRNSVISADTTQTDVYPVGRSLNGSLNVFNMVSVIIP